MVADELNAGSVRETADSETVGTTTDDGVSETLRVNTSELDADSGTLRVKTSEDEADSGTLKVKITELEEDSGTLKVKVSELEADSGTLSVTIPELAAELTESVAKVTIETGVDDSPMSVTVEENGNSVEESVPDKDRIGAEEEISGGAEDEAMSEEAERVRISDVEAELAGRAQDGYPSGYDAEELASDELDGTSELELDGTSEELIVTVGRVTMSTVDEGGSSMLTLLTELLAELTADSLTMDE